MNNLLSALGMHGLAVQDVENLYNTLQIASSSGVWANLYAYQQLERERFYRSCSQNWLNAMLDVEIGA